MPQIRPITDLRNTNEISEELMENVTTDAAIREAEQEVAEGGKLLDAHEALSYLRRKHNL